ncbi:MAG TPA: hypothetical protein VGC30_12330 [Dokdonella sp.]
MRNPRVLILGVLAAAVLAAAYALAPRTPPAAAPAAATTAPASPPPAPVAAPPPPLAEATATPSESAPAPPATDDAEPAPAAAPADSDAPAETPATPPADPDRATDLFAALLAEQEAEPEQGRLPDPARDLWKRFDGEQKDGAWSAPAEAHLQNALDEWLDGLPEGMGDHLALVHVECRATLCQVLAADNDLAGQGARAESGQEWQQAVAALRGQPWWSESGFTDMTTQVTARDGYMLYTSYLLRGDVPPPSP